MTTYRVTAYGKTHVTGLADYASAAAVARWIAEPRRAGDSIGAADGRRLAEHVRKAPQAVVEMDEAGNDVAAWAVYA